MVRVLKPTREWPEAKAHSQVNWHGTVEVTEDREHDLARAEQLANSARDEVSEFLAERIQEYHESPQLTSPWCEGPYPAEGYHSYDEIQEACQRALAALEKSNSEEASEFRAALDRAKAAGIIWYT